ncbi:diuretic hormone receptor isoform X1 [Bactrocera neohumeralis]|uniref:diuretic hormone receptor isoform X1 n=1 Tax=Bactrocera neohumeralis TaxID=98809 RepID=UPI002165B287|nr:diuretic hormone receptor isoform X1 [Bactrocera neohumeralis]XP_050326738.1 diuretic hormone receptor isoform X1 [Bactrocera neohumeralis]XP_050326739.1 diuretic hormone receptor isoform X1 [Bactrocera neohumeralis]XP_050326741.1 diuretic hormone receptor isoform X1 [Bactrocera neohumeralis]
MSNTDLRALFENLDDSAAAAAAEALDIENIIANFSTEMLRMNKDVLNATAMNEISINQTLKALCEQSGRRNAPRNDSANYLTCPPSFDSVLCWQETLAGTTAIQPCFDEFKGIHYNTAENVTRKCLADGTWDNYTEYMRCQPATILPPQLADLSPTIELSSYIYFIGYFISLTSLILALIVFYFFKDLKCLRNTIHANLFLTYILAALLWILTMCLHVMTEHPSEAGCITLVMMFHYFNLTNFFWMFVEGLYLYTLVVQTFSSDNIRFIIYACIGWGCPAVITFIWSIAKIFATSLESEHFNGLFIQCSWLRESHIDWIFQAPTCLVLILNLIFLIRIMWVLITKLRSANTLETRQYHKASKALLVLIPLFGVTYLIVLFCPGGEGITQNVFENLRVFLISTQGFFVSLFFCFLNSEVRQTLRHRFMRWRDNRNLRNGSIHRNRRNRLSKDYSHRSRTESLRLTSTSPVPNGFNHDENKLNQL